MKLVADLILVVYSKKQVFLHHRVGLVNVGLQNLGSDPRQLVALVLVLRLAYRARTVQGLANFSKLNRAVLGLRDDSLTHKALLPLWGLLLQKVWLVRRDSLRGTLEFSGVNKVSIVHPVGVVRVRAAVPRHRG